MDWNQHNRDITLGLIHYFGLSKDYCFCGYCKSTRNPGNTFGLWSYYLLPKGYQGLIDRNWRRCGKYIYKPVNKEVCCPMYMIRCDATNFKLSNSQKKVIKRFNNYIKYDIKPSRFSRMKVESMNIDSERSKLENISEKSVKIIDSKNINQSEGVDKITKMNEDSFEDHLDINCENTEKIVNNVDSNVKKSLIKITKKKFLRRQKLIQKIMKREVCSEEQAKQILLEKSRLKQKTKTLEDFLSEIDNFSGSKHTFKTKIIEVKSKLENNSDLSDYEVFKKYQMKIHEEAENDISYRSYKRFLLDSPLDYIAMKKKYHELPRFYGSYHQHYYIDDRLIAVGVIDILPKCISSVYLYYDPEFFFLNLGVYSALNEIAMIRKFSKILPDLKYYYLGYYVHQCPKMRYKAKYLPSDLLCSETFRWFDIKSCIEKLEKSKYSRFCDDENVRDEDGSSIEDNEIKVLYFNKALTYRDFKRITKNKEHEEKIAEYARLVGRKCSHTLLYYIDTD